MFFLLFIIQEVCVSLQAIYYRVVKDKSELYKTLSEAMYKFLGNEQLNYWMMTIGNLLPSKDKVITLQSIDTVSTHNQVIKC